MRTPRSGSSPSPRPESCGPHLGRSGGYSFAQSPTQVSVLDVVLTIDGPEPAFRCTGIRRQGPLGLGPEKCRKPCAVSRTMAAADAAWRAALKGVTIADLARDIDADSAGTAMGWVRQWLAGTGIAPTGPSRAAPLLDAPGDALSIEP